MPAGRPKGLAKTGGRQKGTPNKRTARAMEAIEMAFENLGGVEGLTAWAEMNQDAFYGQVWPKILPLQVKHQGDADEPVMHVFRWAGESKKP